MVLYSRQIRVHYVFKSQYASLLAENTVGDSLEAGYYMEVVWTFILEQH